MRRRQPRSTRTSTLVPSTTMIQSTMHGLGNDFVVSDARERRVEMTTARAHAIADRRHCIGCHQLILLEPSNSADVKMRIFNADGGEVEACGNATRCVATLIGKPAVIETLGGMLQIGRASGRERVGQYV